MSASAGKVSPGSGSPSLVRYEDDIRKLEMEQHGLVMQLDLLAGLSKSVSMAPMSGGGWGWKDVKKVPDWLDGNIVQSLAARNRLMRAYESERATSGHKSLKTVLGQRKKALERRVKLLQSDVGVKRAALVDAIRAIARKVHSLEQEMQEYHVQARDIGQMKRVEKLIAAAYHNLYQFEIDLRWYAVDSEEWRFQEILACYAFLLEVEDKMRFTVRMYRNELNINDHNTMRNTYSRIAGLIGEYDKLIPKNSRLYNALMEMQRQSSR